MAAAERARLFTDADFGALGCILDEFQSVKSIPHFTRLLTSVCHEGCYVRNARNCETMGRFFDVMTGYYLEGGFTLAVITASQRNGFHYGWAHS